MDFGLLILTEAGLVQSKDIGGAVRAAYHPNCHLVIEWRAITVTAL